MKKSLDMVFSCFSCFRCTSWWCLYSSMKCHTTRPHQGYRCDIALHPGQKYNVRPWAFEEEKTALKNQWYDVVYNEIPS